MASKESVYLCVFSKFGDGDVPCVDTQHSVLNCEDQTGFVSSSAQPGSYHSYILPAHDLNDVGFGVKSKCEEGGRKRDEDTHQWYDAAVVPIWVNIIWLNAWWRWEQAGGFDFDCIATNRHLVMELEVHQGR